jgi:hypothetical protein
LLLHYTRYGKQQGKRDAAEFREVQKRLTTAFRQLQEHYQYNRGGITPKIHGKWICRKNGLLLIFNGKENVKVFENNLLVSSFLYRWIGKDTVYVHVGCKTPTKRMDYTVWPDKIVKGMRRIDKAFDELQEYDTHIMKLYLRNGRLTRQRRDGHRQVFCRVDAD